MARASAVAVVVALIALGGCVLVTGGTDGYTAADAGGRMSATCQTPKDCTAGQSCCYELDGGAATRACQASCPSMAQSCAVASDCGDGGICLVQTCAVEAGTFMLSASVSTCGVIPFCSQ